MEENCASTSNKMDDTFKSSDIDFGTVEIKDKASVDPVFVKTEFVNPDCKIEPEDIEYPADDLHHAVDIKEEECDTTQPFSVFKMSSDDDITEMLIAEIQLRPALWNTKLASFKNRNLRNRLHGEVARILGISKETVASRWKNKKDKYRRELKKVAVLPSGDATGNYTSTWPYFEMMSFLKDVMTPAVKQPHDDITISDMEGEEDDRTETQSIIDPTVLVSSPLSASTFTTSSQQGRENRKRLCDRDDKYFEVDNKKLYQIARDADKPEHEELNFFKSLLPYMDKFHPIQKLNVRNKIQQVILDELVSMENSRVLAIRQSTRDSYIRQSTSSQDNNLMVLSSQSTVPRDKIKKKHQLS